MYMTYLVSGMNHQVTPTKYLLQIQVTWELLNSPMGRDSKLGHHLVVCFSHVYKWSRNTPKLELLNWLVVLTPLKNISQLG